MSKEESRILFFITFSAILRINSNGEGKLGF